MMRIVALTLALAFPVVASAQTEPDLTLSASPGSESSDRFDLELVGWPMLASGAAMVAGFFATYARLDALNADPGYTDYRVYVGSMASASSNVCDVASTDPSALAAHARSVCGEASILEPLAWSMLALGSAGMIAGLTLVLVDANQTEAPVSVAVGPGGVSVRGSF